MSNWYKKAELARRFSIFYCASLVSGAVGGLIGKYVRPGYLQLPDLFLSGLNIGEDARSRTVSCVEMVVLE